MGNMKSDQQSDIKFKYTTNKNISVKTLNSLLKNNKLIAFDDMDNIFKNIIQLLKLVKNMNNSNKLIFFKKYINIYNNTINIEQICKSTSNEFSDVAYVRIVKDITISIYSNFNTNKKLFTFSKSFYSLLSINYNLILDQIILSIQHMLNYFIIENNTNLSVANENMLQIYDACTECNNVGYYHEYNNSFHYCIKHKTENMNVVVFNNRSSHYDDTTYCIICMKNKKNIVFIPCGHILVCKTCNITKTNKCYICMSRVKKTYRVYY